MLVDTGAKLSCVNKNFLDGLRTMNNATFPVSRSSVPLLGAGGKPLACSGFVHLPLRLKACSTAWPFYVIDNLSSDLLAGIDLLTHIGASVDAASNTVSIQGPAAPVALIAQHDVGLPPLATSTVKVRAANVFSNRCVPNTTGMIVTSDASCTLPGIVATDTDGFTTVAVVNRTASPASLARGTSLGSFVRILQPEPTWLSAQQTLNAIAPVQTPPPAPPAPAVTQQQRLARRQRLRSLLRVDCPPEWLEKYTNLLLQFDDVFSLSDSDLGHTTAYEHRIDLTTDNPVHVQQFRIPLKQQQFVNARVRELADLNLLEPSTSPYNTPIFAVPKKTNPGEPQRYRLIQDLRALNAITKVDKHSIMDVRACLDKIGQLQAAVFSSIDLRAGYYQMGLAKESRPYTAFTLPDLGQWQWRVTTMGLTGAPASFSKLMEKVMEGLQFILRYLDDLLAASRDHATHLQHLEQVLTRLRRYGLKINPEKSTFGAKTVEYLGHTVSSKGFTIGEHKFAAIKDFPEPTNKASVQQFLGLANYFRQLLPSYQRHVGHLSALLTANQAWKAGPLPPRARLAFFAIKEALLTRPVVTFPDPSLPFTLATDAAAGDDNTPGGLGAVLTQHKDGHDRVIAYASRALKQHEKKQSAFQLELQAVIWALDHFGPYLRHNTFSVVTDHRPVAHLSQQQLKSLHRLHEKMLEFPCTIQYRPGVLNDIADALSRNPVSSICTADEADTGDLLRLQDQCTWCLTVAKIMDNDAATTAAHPELAKLKDRFTRRNGLLAISDPEGLYDGARVLVPRLARPGVLRRAHDHALAGHRGINATLAAVRARFWWPDITAHVKFYVSNCATCQKSKNPANFSAKAPIHPLPPPDMPNQRVHADLFGPLPTSAKNNKWILTMTCAFSKFVRVIPLPNKEAVTVADAIMTHWIAVFGPMRRLCHDQGREFNNKLLAALLANLDIHQRTTSAMAPSVNGEAEIFNKWIASYLKTMQSSPNEDWEGRLATLCLAYNSAIHSSHQQQPAAVMYGRRFILPQLDAAPPTPPASWADHQQKNLRDAWLATSKRLSAAAEKMMTNQTAARLFTPMQGERVLLYFPRTALAAKGPPKLQQQWKEAVVLAQLGPATYLVRQRFAKYASSMVHANRLKPFMPRLVLPPTQWCVDPPANHRPPQLPPPAQPPITAQQQQPVSALLKNAPQTGSHTKKTKKKKKKRRDKDKRRQIQPPAQSVPSRIPAHEVLDHIVLPPPAPPTQLHHHHWLRSSPGPAPTPRTPPRPPPPPSGPASGTRSSSGRFRHRFLSRIRSAEQQQHQDSPAAAFFSCSSSSSDSDPPPAPQQQPPPAPQQQPPPPGRPGTRSQPSQPEPRPPRQSAARRELNRLATSLQGWLNPAASSSSSSSTATSPPTEPATQPPP